MRTSALFAEHRWTDFQHKIVREPKCLSARSHVLQTSLLSHQKQSTTKPSISLHLGRTLLQLGNSSSSPPPSPPPIRIAAKVYRWRLATVASCIGGGQHWRRKFSRETGTETERRECASTALLIRARRGARAHTVEEKGRVERSVFSTSAGNATGNGKLFNLRLRRTSDSVTPLK